jgi:hypothetical protein
LGFDPLTLEAIPSGFLSELDLHPFRVTLNGESGFVLSNYYQYETFGGSLCGPQDFKSHTLIWARDRARSLFPDVGEAWRFIKPVMRRHEYQGKTGIESFLLMPKVITVAVFVRDQWDPDGNARYRGFIWMQDDYGKPDEETLRHIQTVAWQ